MTIKERDRLAHRLPGANEREQARLMVERRFAQLSALRRDYANLTEHAFKVHGDGDGVLIAGVLRDHFPPYIKNTLRKIAHEITETIDQAYVFWRQSGRRDATFRRALANQPTHNSRY